METHNVTDSDTHCLIYFTFVQLELKADGCLSKISTFSRATPSS